GPFYEKSREMRWDGSKNPRPEPDLRRNLTDSCHTVPQSDNPSPQMSRHRHIATSRVLRTTNRGHVCPIPRLRAAARVRRAVTGSIVVRYISAVQQTGHVV